MKILSYGMRGPQVQLLQLALERAGFSAGAADGIFGQNTLRVLRRFQESRELVPDGIAGRATHAALRPFYTGYLTHVLRPGDSFYRLAAAYGTTVAAIAAANPGLNPMNLPVGASVTVPLSFAVVPTNIDWCSELVAFCCEGISMRYPFVARGSIGQSVMGRPLWRLTLGNPENARVLYNAAHHANEWITVPLLLRFTEELARAYAFDLEIFGKNARSLLQSTELSVIPCVNPDGLDLVTGDLDGGAYYEGVRSIAAAYPAIPFPNGWKANIRGTDLNLQYPAGWENARDIKFAQGFTSPAPRDYVGTAPLSAPEARAMYDYTLAYSPALTLSYHTQGEVIYWKFLNFDPPRAAEIARLFSAVSGYAVETTPYASGFAGYKDWFIQNYNRPGYTVEAGSGVNPLPIRDFSEIYRKNLGILTSALAVFSDENL